jgi:hypothetical protein
MAILSGLVSLLLVLGFFTQIYAAEAVTVKGEVIDTYWSKRGEPPAVCHRLCQGRYSSRPP